MARPHPALVELAAGRAPGDIDDGDIVASAVDHGMQGLLWSWVRADHVDHDWALSLAGADLAIRRHHLRLWDVLASTVARLSALGIDVATAKGVTAEARWYDRAGERPCGDVDLLIGPDSVKRAGDVLDELQPDHPLRPRIDELVLDRGLQAVTTTVDGVAVDVHFDLLKLGVPTRRPELVWARTVPHPLPDGSTVPVPDPEISLVHLLVHMNKDSFPWLLAFADVARILKGPLDWAFIDEFVRSEGIDVVAYQSLATVTHVLGLPDPGVRTGGPRARLWTAVWPDSAILLGSAGSHRSRRQDAVPLLLRGRWRDTVVWAWRTVFPPAVALSARYPDVRGPYVWRLARGRFATARGRGAAFRERVDTPALRVLRRAVHDGPRWIQARGRSMGWSIPDGARVRVEPGSRPRRGEVWAFGNDDGAIVVHRCRGAVAGGFRFQGDVNVRDDGVITTEQLIGRVTEVGPGHPQWRSGPAVGAVQRVPRVAVATAVRAGRRVRSRSHR